MHWRPHFLGDSPYKIIEAFGVDIADRAKKVIALSLRPAGIGRKSLMRSLDRGINIGRATESNRSRRCSRRRVDNVDCLV
ncbi:hypothetical protein D3C75_890590 [compost metagenome]